ncbi:tRNA uracil 4-sulfurtransferase ThiI [Bhargavaea beijingensis]|uniref:tRNA uracil 4-sulfurtransferase ThiI n=1 Tax=Bhargavaea beijingensis TaxID=426756 RepID=UPI0022247996|nr:tRNA uracil 4-sulfurtransferase ThiI [Bhargavaea beijingensis]MCW1928528.1 tRNA 4-thiouridine(8) synthase ThiI [Bhargavaea beijingensis]
MMYHEIMIRYGELSLKGKNRNVFIRKLRDNIRRIMKDLPTVKVKSEHDRMYLFAEEGQEIEEALTRLQDVFGIQSFSPAVRCKANLDSIKETAERILSGMETEGKTFKVEVRRADKTFPLKTIELQQELGGHLLPIFPGLVVKMKHPEIRLLVDIREDGAYLSTETIQGAGGLPAGSNGHALLMLSGGIDSPVAGYLMMKRGLKLDVIHFHSPPFTSEQSKQKVVELAERLSTFGTKIRMHTIHFTEIQQAIQGAVPSALTMTTTRRLMMKIADRVREEIGAKAIVTGESLGQVASQTLDSLSAINEVTSTPVLRPLIAMDKLDIIGVAEKIGTYEISIRPFEDCCTIFTPANPATKPKTDKVIYYESNADFGPLIEQAVAGREITELPFKKEKDPFSDLL